ncbi:MAG: HD domain-containing protein [Allomuricauda sp.]
MKEDQLINHTIAFVKGELKNAEGGHDWFHIERVYNTSKLLLEHEKGDSLIVELAALLHDIADPKFHDGDENIGPKMARNFLESQSVDEKTIEHVVNIIKHMSFKNSLEKDGTRFSSRELYIVQDADRLDAIGAIGIARAFNYGGFKNRELYNPAVPPQPNMTKEEYKKSTAPTINHFYEKLLLLKDKMNTETGKKLAEERHLFMLKYLEQFYKEWNGKE